MALVEVVQNRRILQAGVRVKVLLAEAVKSGDPLGINAGTWVLSADAAAEQPILIALEDGAIGDVIEASPFAVVELTHLAANVPTLGEKIAVSDAGAYVPAGAGLPDVGNITSIGSGNTTSVVALNPQAAQLTVVRS